MRAVVDGRYVALPCSSFTVIMPGNRPRISAEVKEGFVPCLHNTGLSKVVPTGIDDGSHPTSNGNSGSIDNLLAVMP